MKAIIATDNSCNYDANDKTYIESIMYTSAYIYTYRNFYLIMLNLRQLSISYIQKHN